MVKLFVLLAVLLLAVLSCDAQPGSPSRTYLSCDSDSFVQSLEQKPEFSETLVSGIKATLDKNGFSISPFNVKDLTCVKYTTQVVSGLNYYIQYEINGEPIHVRVYKHWSGTWEVSNAKKPADGEELGMFF